MNQTQIEKLKRFIHDPVMSNAVYQTLLGTFLSDDISKDVYVLAASRLAVKFLNEGWKRLEKYKIATDETMDKSSNVGL